MSTYTLGEAESFTYLFFLLLLIEFNEGVKQSAVIKVDANDWIRMVGGHCVKAKTQGEQLTICSVS